MLFRVADGKIVNKVEEMFVKCIWFIEDTFNVHLIS